MRMHIVTEKVTLTAEPGSIVIISKNQYPLISNKLSPPLGFNTDDDMVIMPGEKYIALMEKCLNCEDTNTPEKSMELPTGESSDEAKAKEEQIPEKPLSEMTTPELMKKAKELGIELKKGLTNQEIIEAIEKRV